MPISSKLCPNCHQPHGISAFRVLNSSAAQPVKCRQCGLNFYQSGSLWWFVLPVFWPPFVASGPYSFLIFLVLLVLGLLAVGLFLRYRYPLKAGPRFG